MSATATMTDKGVVLQWRSLLEAENIGFNVYRVKDGQRVRINSEIIPGSLLIAKANSAFSSGYSVSWTDPYGTADSVYYIESVNLDGLSKLYDAIKPIARKDSGFATTSLVNSSQTRTANSFEKFFPASERQQADVSPAAIEEQWAIAGQSALKIGIKKDGWFRVTQPQMVAAGFNPVVDIRNLQLFEGAQEVAINTSQSTGPFDNNDYIEFYGRGLDTPTTDTRIYYLVAGTKAGKRVSGDLQVTAIESPSPASAKPSSPADTSPGVPPPAMRFNLIWQFLKGSVSDSIESIPFNDVSRTDRSVRDRKLRLESRSDLSTVQEQYEEHAASPLTATSGNANLKTELVSGEAARAIVHGIAAESVKQNTVVSKPARSVKSSRKNRKSKRLRRNTVQRNHADEGRFPPANFEYVSERKDRTVYFSGLLNGDTENFFGKVLTFNATTPPTLTINTPNLDTSATSFARVEIALQAAKVGSHQIGIEVNNQAVGSFSLIDFQHDAKEFNVPPSQLINGTNTIKFVTASGELSLVDYVRITYPHTLRADLVTSCSTPGRAADESLKFSLRGFQSVKVDGFCSPLVRLIDYTDPFAVHTSKAPSNASASGYEITVPTNDARSKDIRLLYAFVDGQFQQPASISLNAPSALNAVSNNSDFLIVTNKNFIASMEPLKTARQNQGMTVSVIDVEDVYDEFSFGLHGPQALKDFLSYAATQWATPPRYVVFAGDATYDPRNYANNPAGIDFVPTKLVDATYNETSSDEWLTDFDGDGIGDIPIGRLPITTTAEADLIVSKIVNFSPVNVPQTAMLVADAQNGYYYDFNAANDQVQALLPISMTVQRVNLETAPSIDSARNDIISGFNSGRALVNYSGHGNIDVWSGAAIFTAANARSLTNGNKLSFVVVMDCLNGYFQEPNLESMSEALVRAPAGGAVAAFASSGLTIPEGQHEMSLYLYSLIYGPQPISLGDAIKAAKAQTSDIDVRRTWIYFGDPSIRIR